MQGVFLQCHRNVKKKLEWMFFCFECHSCLVSQLLLALAKSAARYMLLLAALQRLRLLRSQLRWKNTKEVLGDGDVEDLCSFPILRRWAGTRKILKLLKATVCYIHISCASTERRELKKENTVFFSRLLPQWNYFWELQGRSRLLLWFTLALLTCTENPVLQM